jgi:hypothetical protein
VDIDKIRRENFRLALQDDSSPRHQQFYSPNSSGKRASGGGGAANSNATNNPSSATNTLSVNPIITPTQQSLSSMNLNSSMGSYKRGGILRHVPSAEVMETLSRMRAETRWQRLEDDSAHSPTSSYLVLTPQRPFYMLWATKRFTSLLGYLVHDLIAYEFSVLFGPHVQAVQRVENALEEVATSQGLKAPQHMVLSLPRRDGHEAMVSLHVFPVFEGQHSTPASSAFIPRLPNISSMSQALVTPSSPPQNPLLQQLTPQKVVAGAETDVAPNPMTRAKDSGSDDSSSAVYATPSGPSSTQPPTDVSMSVCSDSTTDETPFADTDTHAHILRSVLSESRVTTPQSHTPMSAVNGSNKFHNASSHNTNNNNAKDTGKYYHGANNNGHGTDRKVAYLVLHFSTPRE